MSLKTLVIGWDQMRVFYLSVTPVKNLYLDLTHLDDLCVSI